MGSSPAAHWISQAFALLTQRAEVPVVLDLPRWRRKCALVVFLLATGLLMAAEMKFSWIESRFFAAEASKASYKLAPGSSRSIRYPAAGPYDLQRGYSTLPAYRGPSGPARAIASRNRRAIPAVRSFWSGWACIRSITRRTRRDSISSTIAARASIRFGIPNELSEFCFDPAVGGSHAAFH